MMNSTTKNGASPREEVPIELLNTELASNTEANSNRPSNFSGFTNENNMMRGRKMNPIGVIARVLPCSCDYSGLSWVSAPEAGPNSTRALPISCQ